MSILVQFRVKMTIFTSLIDTLQPDNEDGGLRRQQICIIFVVSMAV